MPTTMKATMVVLNYTGAVIMESSHPEFELAWAQVGRELRKNDKTFHSSPEVMESLDYSWEDYFAALHSAPGEVVVRVVDLTLTFVVTAYQPVGSYNV